jgi:hypothetical protein
MAKKAQFDTLRSLAFGSISGTYAAVGAALTVEPRIMYITNGTAGAMIFSIDNTNADGNFAVLPGQTLAVNLTANMIPGKDDGFYIAKGTVMYVKQIAAPTSGAVYIAYVY